MTKFAKCATSKLTCWCKLNKPRVIMSHWKLKLRIFTHFIISKGYLFLKEEKKQAHNFLTYCLQSFAPGRCHNSHSNYEQLKSSFLNLKCDVHRRWQTWKFIKILIKLNVESTFDLELWWRFILFIEFLFN